MRIPKFQITLKMFLNDRALVAQRQLRPYASNFRLGISFLVHPLPPFTPTRRRDTANYYLYY